MTGRSLQLRGVPARLRRDPLFRAVVALDPPVRRTLAAVAAGVAALGCAVGLMAASAWLIARAAQHPPVMYLQVAVVATRAFGIGRGVLRYVERLVSHDVALRGVAALRERLYVRLAAADPATAAGLRRGDLLARVGADVDTLADVVVRSLLPFAVSVTTALAAATLVALLLPPAGLVVAAGLLVAAVVAPWLAAVGARRAERGAAQARSDSAAEVLALLDGVAELTVAGAVPARVSRLRALDDVLARRLDEAAAPAAAAVGVGTLATGLAMVGSLVLGVQAVAAGSMRHVLLAVVTLVPLAAAEAVAGLPQAATGLVRARAAAERVMALLDAPAADPDRGPTPSEVDHRHHGRRPTSEAAVGGTQAAAAGPRGTSLPRPHLVADGLAVGWPDADPVLTGFDLDLAPGRRVAVVGGSGCGKTTLLLTLAGLLPARAGRVRLVAPVEADLADVDPATLRRTLSLTAEDAHVFTTTVRENLRVARPDADDAALEAALDRAGLAAWRAGLPDGLDTMLGSGGAGVSGGEHRRLLLARALLVGAGVLLLDEPGEHLDPATADGLLRDVLRPGAGAAVVVVTHRLAPLDAADEVVVLDAGRVTARGSHAWLLAHHEPYRDAVRAEEGLVTA